MRRRLALTLLALPLLACEPAAAWAPDVGSAADYAKGRRGSISFAVRTERRLYSWRARTSVPSASVVKAMLLVAYLRRPEVRSRPLRRGDRRLLAPMIRWSSNPAANRVIGLVGTGALVRLARHTRMRRFRPSFPIWGNSCIDAADQTRFFLHVERRVPRRHRRAALRLLGSIVRSQRWGIARVRPPGWALYFKGGWGSATGGVDHQVALLRRGSRRLSVAILTTVSPSHAYAKRTLRGVAARLLRGLGPKDAPL
jgi:beta-lactamase class A